jgi:sialic acid synthase SpsE
MYIIGDPGSCHGGTLEGCIEAINVAKESGIDSIKFQLFEGSNNGNIELPRRYWGEIVACAKSKDLDIFASVFDLEAIDLLIETGIKKAKLAYSQNFNLKLIKKLKENDFEIWASGDEKLYPHYADKRFYCISEYPPKAMGFNTIGAAWDGISSHYLGYKMEQEFCKTVKWSYLEKHFHLNRKVECPDYYIALSPKELGGMVKCLKQPKLVLGSPKFPKN